MSKEFDEWVNSPDCRLRMVLISADRLSRLAKIRAPRVTILHEMELLEKRINQAVVVTELNPDWVPGEDIVPE